MKLLLDRHGNGIGDWLFMLAAMKHVNRCWPSVELVVDFSHAKDLPPLVREAFRASDVTWAEYAGQAVDRRIDHVIYPRDRDANGEHYVLGMLRQIARILGGSVDFDPGLVPEFDREIIHGLSGHVAIAAGAKLAAKDWGWSRYSELARLLQERRPEIGIVSIGAGHDRVIAAAQAWHGRGFKDCAGAIASVRCLVCGEHGLAVLAAFLGVPAVVIYRRGDMRRLDYPGLEKTFEPDVYHVLRLLEGVLA